MPFFGRMRGSDLTTDHVRRYISARRAEGAQPATVNRELALLKRALNLALQCTPPKVRIIPHIPMLKESNVRKGFLHSDKYALLAEECGHIGLWMRALFECGYTYGWRHEELLDLRVRQVEVMAGTIRLDPGTTKNDDGREVAMTKAVRELLAECVHGKQPNDYVFTREDGTPVRDFRNAWANVTVAVDLGELLCPRCREGVDPEKRCHSCARDWKRNDLVYQGLLFHDLRRTAVRNMVRAGISERVAMTISGHKTRSVFDRYHIVASSDLREATRKLEASQSDERKTLEQAQFGQSSGIVVEKSTGIDAQAENRPKGFALPN
jgi:integrase